MEKYKTKTVDDQVLEITERFFDDMVKTYQVVAANEDHPAGPWRGDLDFGTLLGMKAMARLLFGDEHELTKHMVDRVRNLTGGRS